MSAKTVVDRRETKPNDRSCINDLDETGRLMKDDNGWMN